MDDKSKHNATYWIHKLQLNKHPEGGYYKEIYRSEEKITKNALPLRFQGDRNFSTSIYFLLDKMDISTFHRIKSDEIWHFYKGDSVVIYEIKPKGELIEHLLGDDPEKNETLQVVISKESWFAAELTNKESFALMGCTVAPGFDFNDFEMAKKIELKNNHPNHSKIINRLCIL